MAAHCSVSAWRIPWTEEPGGVWGSQSWTQQVDFHFTSDISTTAPIILRNTSLEATAQLLVIHGTGFFFLNRY